MECDRGKGEIKRLGGRVGKKELKGLKDGGEGEEWGMKWRLGELEEFDRKLLGGGGKYREGRRRDVEREIKKIADDFEEFE